MHPFLNTLNISEPFHGTEAQHLYESKFMSILLKFAVFFQFYWPVLKLISRRYFKSLFKTS